MVSTYPSPSPPPPGVPILEVYIFLKTVASEIIQEKMIESSLAYFDVSPNRRLTRGWIKLNVRKINGKRPNLNRAVQFLAGILQFWDEY